MTTRIPTDPRFQNITGALYGRWLVLGYEGRVGTNHNWLCRCDCGTQKVVQGNNLKSGKSTSCGCFHAEVTAANNKTHGLARTPEHRIWCGMKSRCSLPNRLSWKDYGGRGIKVCKRWQRFENFLSDMGPRPSPKHSIERDDVNGDYEPGNCRWATKLEQANNTRANRYVEFRGEMMSLSDAARAAGFKPIQVFWRLHEGWSVDRALHTPLRGARV
jgi:hypothetical protein